MKQNEFINLIDNHNSFIKGKVYIDIPYIIAMKKAAPYTIGKGLIFNSDKENIQSTLSEFYSKNKIYEKLFQSEIQNSIFGRSILYLLITKTNDLTFRVATPSQNARVSKVDEIEQIAEIYSQPYATDTPFIEKVQFFKKKCIITTFAVDNSKIAIGTTWDKAQENLIPIKIQKYNTGINRIPVIEIINLPYPNLYGNSTIKAIPDTLGVRPLIQDIQDNIKFKRKEMRLNRTRFIGDMADDFLQNLNNTTTQELINNDGWIRSKTADYSKTQSGNGTGLAFADPKFQSYIINQDASFDLVYKGCGYSWDSFNNSTYTNKTESLMGNKLDMETTMIKQQLRIEQLYPLFDYVLIHKGIWDGKGDRPYSMKFSNSLMVDSLKLVERNNSLLKSGIISREEFRAELDDISLEQAKERIKAVDELTNEEIRNTNKLNKELNIEEENKDIEIDNKEVL